jgi:glyoxylase I family protein
VSEVDGLHHVSLSVRDVDASARWYARIFGFVELFREDGADRRAVVMGFAAGGYSVGLVEHRPAEGAGFDPRRLGLDHLAFTVASQEALDGWAVRLTEHAVEHSGVITVPPGAILNLKDPDGLAIALFWDRS